MTRKRVSDTIRAAVVLSAVLLAASAAAQDSVPAGSVERLPMAGGKSIYPHGTCAPQKWPREALRYEIEGTVRIGYQVASDGRVNEARVTRSSGWALLDEASIAAAKTCTFSPEQTALAQGREVPVEFVWKLDGERVRPNLVPGSCVSSGAIDGFQPYDNRPTDATGVKVRFLVEGNGQPHAIRLEGSPDAALAEQVMRHLLTCHFAFDPASAGTRTDTMAGRVLLR